MSKFLKSLSLAAVATMLSLPAVAQPLGLGRAALPEEISAWNLDIHPDGTGLPDGEGDVLDGEEIFATGRIGPTCPPHSTIFAARCLTVTQVP